MNRNKMDDAEANSSTPSSRQRERRPDRAVYVPRAKRNVVETPTRDTDIGNGHPRRKVEPCEHVDKCAANRNNSLISDESIDLFSLRIPPDHETNGEPHCAIPVNHDDVYMLNRISVDCIFVNNKNCDNPLGSPPPPPPEMTENLLNSRLSQPKSHILDDWDDGKSEDKDVLEFQRASEEINRSNRRIIKQSFISDVLLITDPDASKTKSDSVESSKKRPSLEPKDEITTCNPDEDDWDNMFDDNGDCLDPKLWEELTNAVGNVTIEKPKSDYKPYQTKAQVMLTNDEFPHVVEIYDFPSEFKTQDLLAVFSPYKGTGFEIKWVDDTHALGVFSSSQVAAEVLSSSHPLVKTRPLREGTLESRHKARRSAEFLQPYRTRPETCAALARRLVTGALGVKLKTAREEREKERQVLKQAKERKLLAARQRDEVWDDENFTAKPAAN